MVALVLRVKWRFGEPAFSLLSRLAHRNFCTTEEFCHDLGISWQGVLNGVPNCISQLADLADVDRKALQSASPRHLDARRSELSGLVINRSRLSVEHVRGCPQCLAKDCDQAADPEARVPSLRIEWLYELCFLCPEHRSWLVTLWSTPDPRQRFDPVPRFAELEQIPNCDSTERVAPAAYDLWLTQRLQGLQGSHWLDQFDFQAATEICDLLGRTLVRAAFPQLRDMSPADRHAAICRAFNILTEGEAGLRAQLSIMQQTGGSANDGPARRYGVFYSNLDRYLTGPEYLPFKAILRDHIFQTWPVAAGQKVLGEALPRRRLHSVVTASRETGVPRDRLRAILSTYGKVSSRADGTYSAWELFDAEGAADLLARAARGIPLKEVLKRFNFSRSQIETLRAAGYLAPDLEGEGFAPLWDPEKADAFLSSLFDGAVPVKAGELGWEPIGAAGLRLRIPPGEIIRMRLDGRLQQFGRVEGVEGYHGLMVKVDDLLAIRQEITENLNIEAFAKTVGLGWSQARRLVMSGLTPSTELRNPASGAIQRYITPPDLQAFNQRFVTLTRLAAERNQPWQAVTLWLKGLAVKRFTVDDEGFGQLYERCAISAALEPGCS